jgi:4-hydroxy-tetrahydrodipicolinate reductase
VGGKAVQGGTKIRIGVSGARGRMGSLTCKAVAADPDLLLVAAIDPALSEAEAATGAGGEKDITWFKDLEQALEAGGLQVVVDFSTPATVRANVLACVSRRVPAVVGTTGLTARDLADIEEQVAANGVPVLVAPNFAMGAVLMMQFAQQAAQHFRACEVVELHHEDKVDSPSGTARLTRVRIEEIWRQAGLEKEVPVHSVRLPGLMAHQEVIFGGLGETLTLRHDSLSRESFMPGVLLAIKRVRTLQGLVVGLENIL